MKSMLKTLSQKLYNLNSGGETARTYFTLASISFVLGAGLEYTMIHWRPNGHNFYNTYKKNQAKIIAEERLQKEALKKELQYFQKCHTK